mgnify:CR=1 FL=1
MPIRSLSRHWSRHLYLRIWLAVVGVVTLLMLVVGWAWRATVEHHAATPPSREWVVLNAQGEVLDVLEDPVEFLVGGNDLLARVEAALQGHDIGLLSEAGMPAVADWQPPLRDGAEQPCVPGLLLPLMQDGRYVVRITADQQYFAINVAASQGIAQVLLQFNYAQPTA